MLWAEVFTVGKFEKLEAWSRLTDFLEVDYVEQCYIIIIMCLNTS